MGQGWVAEEEESEKAARVIREMNLCVWFLPTPSKRDLPTLEERSRKSKGSLCDPWTPLSFLAGKWTCRAFC